MQGAIHQQVFEVFRSTFAGPWLEGFASPFNGCLTSFGSAFLALEWHFGSVGSFMDYSFRQGGFCEANPPFSPAIMNGMVDHIENQLELAGENDISLTFAVVVPTALPEEGAIVKKAASIPFDRMLSSPRCRKHFHLAAREHGYLEGECPTQDL